MAEKKTTKKNLVVEEVVVATEIPKDVLFAVVSNDGNPTNLYSEYGTVKDTIPDGCPLIVLDVVSSGVKEGEKRYTTSKVDCDGVIGYVIFNHLKFSV